MITSELAQFIMLIVAIVVSITLFIVVLIKAIKEGFTRRRIAIFVLALGLLFIVYLAYNRREIQPADWAQIMLVLGLVTVTGLYALSAARQADASVKMAKQMAKPRLIPDFWLIGDFSEERYVQFEAWIHNDGNGPAYDIKAEIQDDGKPPSVLATGDITSVLRSHDRKQWLHPDPRLHFPKSDIVQRRFFVIKYKDVDGEYEIRRPFVLTTGEENRPIAHLDRPSRKLLRKLDLEDELP